MRLPHEHQKIHGLQGLVGGGRYISLAGHLNLHTEKERFKALLAVSHHMPCYSHAALLL